ncbi:MAG: hypothetical protein KI790_14680 [Cyclobacteriaceae bacterium]|nr:hypothetical protein [Cyclobacteriaceae bacterium HetDA_MAG_MS6]
MKRPIFEEIQTGKEFNRWYWLKSEMIQICKKADLPSRGSKFDLRDRIMRALDNESEVVTSLSHKKVSSGSLNWARAPLTLYTIIDHNVSFGPNFRNFMKSQIGPKFVCHSDFMEWMKNNNGKTLADAVVAWTRLEDRKKDPTFKRTIAKHNMLSQYVRDYLGDNPTKTLSDALACWKIKKQLPTENGFIAYSRQDIELKLTEH